MYEKAEEGSNISPDLSSIPRYPCVHVQACADLSALGCTYTNECELICVSILVNVGEQPGVMSCCYMDRDDEVDEQQKEGREKMYINEEKWTYGNMCNNTKGI